MESKANYAVIGLMVLILTTGLILSSVWLSVGFNKEDYDLYAVYMSEAVSGLSLDAPVKFNGVKVGFVKNIQLNKKNPQQVQLLLSISHHIPVTVSTTATLISQGITGTTYVGLAASSPSLDPLLKKNGQPYPVIPSKSSLFNQLDSALKGVSEDINAVVVDVQKVFDAENIENVKVTLQNLKNFTAELSEDRPMIHRILSRLDQGMVVFPHVATNLDQAVTAFAQDTIPAANQLLLHLNHMAINLEKTSSDLKRNPSVMIRGAQPEKSGPGE